MALKSTDSGSRLTALGRAMVPSYGMVQFSLRCARCAAFRGVCRLALRWRLVVCKWAHGSTGSTDGEHGGGGV